MQNLIFKGLNGQFKIVAATQYITRIKDSTNNDKCNNDVSSNSYHFQIRFACDGDVMWLPIPVIFKAELQPSLIFLLLVNVDFNCYTSFFFL